MMCLIVCASPPPPNCVCLRRLILRGPLKSQPVQKGGRLGAVSDVCRWVRVGSCCSPVSESSARRRGSGVALLWSPRGRGGIEPCSTQLCFWVPWAVLAGMLVLDAWLCHAVLCCLQSCVAFAPFPCRKQLSHCSCAE